MSVPVGDTEQRFCRHIAASRCTLAAVVPTMPD